MSLDSSVLKLAALSWLRYGKRMPIVCTEVGRWNADVLGVSPSAAIEVEVKVSKADMRAEFRNKTSKHFLYENAQESSVHVPNQFYFIVPSHLADEAVAIAGESAPKAGVISYNAERPGPYHREDVRVLKQAKKLKSAPPSTAMLVAAMMRCSSEVCGLRLREVEFHRTLLRELQASDERFSALMARAGGTLDIESPVDELDVRARELAFCVDGIDEARWQALDLVAKERWLNAAVKLIEGHYVNAKGWIAAPFLY